MAAITYRIAHDLHLLGVPLVPRISFELAHAATGIDIQPGAQVGPRFFMQARAREEVFTAGAGI